MRFELGFILKPMDTYHKGMQEKSPAEEITDKLKETDWLRDFVVDKLQMLYELRKIGNT